MEEEGVVGEDEGVEEGVVYSLAANNLQVAAVAWLHTQTAQTHQQSRHAAAKAATFQDCRLSK